MTVSAYTNNFLFRLIDFASQNWSDDEHDNWKLVDALLQSQFGNFPFALASGTATAVVLDYTPNITPVVSGTYLSWQVTAASTGAMTVTIDGAGPYTVRYLGGAVALGTVQIGDVVQMVYDGTNFNITQPIRIVPNLIIKPSSSGATALTDANDLVIEANGSPGLSVLVPDASIATIRFTAPSRDGYIQFNSTSGNIDIAPEATKKVLILGALETNTSFATPTSTISTQLTVNGNGIGTGVTNPVAGNISNQTPISAGRFTTFTNTTVCANGVATTLTAVPNLGSNITYLVSAAVSSGLPVAYCCVGILSSELGVLRYTALQTATLLSIAISGTNIQGTQTSGASNTIFLSLTRLS